MVLPLAMAGADAVKKNPVLALVPVAAIGGLGFVGYKVFQKFNPFNIAKNIGGGLVGGTKKLGKGIFNIGKSTASLPGKAINKTFSTGKKSSRALKKGGKAIFNAGKTAASSKEAKKVAKVASKSAKKATKAATKQAKKARKKLKKLKFW